MLKTLDYKTNLTQSLIPTQQLNILLLEKTLCKPFIWFIHKWHCLPNLYAYIQRDEITHVSFFYLYFMFILMGNLQ